MKGEREGVRENTDCVQCMSVSCPYIIIHACYGVFCVCVCVCACMRVNVHV